MSLNTDREGTLGISGALTFDSVYQIFLDARKLDFAQTGSVNLSGVSSVDSAGLALLLEWQANAKARGGALSFINAPSDLQRLAALSEATELLGLSPRPGMETG